MEKIVLLISFVALFALPDLEGMKRTRSTSEQPLLALLQVIDDEIKEATPLPAMYECLFCTRHRFTDLSTANLCELGHITRNNAKKFKVPCPAPGCNSSFGSRGWDGKGIAICSSTVETIRSHVESEHPEFWKAKKGNWRRSIPLSELNL